LTRLGAFAVFAGPLAWFVELCCGYPLAATPCFAADHRLLSPDPRWAWTQSGLFAVAAVCALIALWSFLISLSALRRHSAAGSRATFTALWGAAFGGGFFVATLLTGVGLIVLPRCGG
jgi:hypothetical protein